MCNENKRDKILKLNNESQLTTLHLQQNIVLLFLLLEQVELYYSNSKKVTNKDLVVIIVEFFIYIWSM